MKKTLKLLALAALVLALIYLFPVLALVYILCGVYDVSRNKGLNASVIKRYFIGNGLLTWLLSPFNVLLDLLSLPYVNKGVYRLDDLPKPYRDEVRRLIDTANDADLVGKLEEKTRDLARAMIFFKWYGTNIDHSFNVPAFHEKFRYIQTIGVSVFNKRESTSKHFGPFRASLRVLYNLNAIDDPSAYIEVGNVVNYWRDSRLFIFDDTLMHQSFNQSDKSRYCLFVDILRPSLLPGLFAGVVGLIRFSMRGINYIFYKKWTVIEN